MEIRNDKDFKGVFTTRHYGKNEIILELKGAILEFPTRTSIQIGIDQHIEDPVGSFINHSFNPTAKIEKGRVVALTSLSKGQEVTFNYNSTEDKLAEPFKCKFTGEWVKGKNE